MDGDVLELEGHELVAVGLGHTDTDDTSCLHVPALGLVVAGDAVYDGVHLYLAESPAAGRQGVARRPRRRPGPAPDVGDRRAPASWRHRRSAAIDETRRYLDDFEELLAPRPPRLELYRAMRARHPDRVNPGALWGSARAAFPTEVSA